MQRDDWRCKKCRDTETTLHVHHTEYIGGLKPWEYEDKYLITLCEHCHKEVEQLKKDETIIFEKLIIVKNNCKDGYRFMLSGNVDKVYLTIYLEDKFVCGFKISSIDKLTMIAKLFYDIARPVYIDHLKKEKRENKI